MLYFTLELNCLTRETSSITVFTSRKNSDQTCSGGTFIFNNGTGFVSRGRHSTIGTYLAGICHLHIIHNYGSPLEKKLKLDLVLKGIHQVQPNRKVPRLPVTLIVLQKIQQGLSQAPGFESVMLWVACCLRFIGFLHCREFLPQNTSQFDPDCHLTLQCQVAIWVKLHNTFKTWSHLRYFLVLESLNQTTLIALLDDD